MILNLSPIKYSSLPIWIKTKKGKLNQQNIQQQHIRREEEGVKNDSEENVNFDKNRDKS